jgi:hypothetical protein
MAKKRWRVNGTVVGGKYLGEYEADTAEEAVELALDEAHVSFCHQCSGECENAEVEDATAEEITD